MNEAQREAGKIVIQAHDFTRYVHKLRRELELADGAFAMALVVMVTAVKTGAPGLIEAAEEILTQSGAAEKTKASLERVQSGQTTWAQENELRADLEKFRREVEREEGN